MLNFSCTFFTRGGNKFQFLFQAQNEDHAKFHMEKMASKCEVLFKDLKQV